VDRQNFIEEQLLRKHVRKAIRIVMEKKKKKKFKETTEEQNLRSIIKQLIKEAEKTEASPHQSTGINVLEDLLKKIIPVIEQDYKRLTTDATQRESFRAHIINAAENSLAPEKAMAAATPGGLEEASGLSRTRREDELEFEIDREGLTQLVIKRSVRPHDTFVIVKNKDGTYNMFLDPDELKLIKKNVDRGEVLKLAQNLNHKWWKIYSDATSATGPTPKTDREREAEKGGRRTGEPRRQEPRVELQEVDVEVGDDFSTKPEDDDAFIDIEDKPEEPVAEDPQADFGIEGEEVTGRNFAFSTFQKIENQIVDSYSLLDNHEDRNLFFSYLVTNLKLYFDKFEDELRAQVQEPTTPEYEREKGQQLQPEI
jgi:hypothetical protein